MFKLQFFYLFCSCFYKGYAKRKLSDYFHREMTKIIIRVFFDKKQLTKRLILAYND